MLTSKQRAYLKGLANGLQALYQVGKDGITENMVKQWNDALEAKEMIKVHVLDNSLSSTRDIADEAAEKTGAETVQVIGSKFILYKRSVNNPVIEL